MRDTKIFTRRPRKAYNFFGWEGLFAGITGGICTPIDEVEEYNEIFRDVVAPY